MGAIAYHTGGISILNGWLRILGSGSPTIPRSLPGWNAARSFGYYLIADDAFGGFFALDGGALGQGKGDVFYFSPRSLYWEPLDCAYTQFLVWACSDFNGFYDDMTWPDCQAAIAAMSPDRCFFFYPLYGRLNVHCLPRRFEMFQWRRHGTFRWIYGFS